jgi:hypothetical protein
MKAMFFSLSMQSYSPCFAFVCDKAVCGSSMWHVLWGVPSRMTGEKRDTLPTHDGREKGNFLAHSRGR